MKEVDATAVINKLKTVIADQTVQIATQQAYIEQLEADKAKKIKE